MADTLQENVVGLLDYTLTEEDGTLIEATGGGKLFAYLHGHGNLPKALEQVVAGLTEGEHFDAVLPNAFGAPSGREPQAVRKKHLAKKVRESAHVGMPFAERDGEGNIVQLWITALRGGQVWVTTDHPLVGKTLHFKGQVVRVRPATQAELDHGHAHGPDGHQHN